MITVTGCTLAGNILASGRGGNGGAGGAGGPTYRSDGLGGAGGAGGAGGSSLGGGIYASSGTVSLTNCTITTNEARGSPGGTGGAGGAGGSPNHTTGQGGAGGAGGAGTGPRGGGIFFNGGQLDLTNCTIARNAAERAFGGAGGAGGSGLVAGATGPTGAAGLGVAGGVRNGGGTLDALNTLFALNRADNAPDVWGVFHAAVHNLLRVAAGSNLPAADPDANGNLVGSLAHPIDPMVGPLADNGGPTPTLALLDGSPAINAGTSAGAPAADQRGLERDSIPDIGAYEFVIPGSPSLPAPLAGDVLLAVAGEVTVQSHSSANVDPQILLADPLRPGGETAAVQRCWTRDAGPPQLLAREEQPATQIAGSISFPIEDGTLSLEEPNNSQSAQKAGNGTAR
jgi:hypothetical protein